MTDTPKPRLAVALKYEEPRVPRVVASGRGAIAENIIGTASANGVPVRENPELAEALAKLDLDEEIPENLYRAVAQVLAFILRASGHLR